MTSSDGKTPTLPAARDHHTIKTTHDSRLPICETDGKPPGGALDEKRRVRDREKQRECPQRGRCNRTCREEEQQPQAEEQHRATSPRRLELAPGSTRDDRHGERNQPEIV